MLIPVCRYNIFMSELNEGFYVFLWQFPADLKRSASYQQSIFFSHINVCKAKVDFSCYIYLVGHIFICSCILFFWLCYIPFVGAYIYLFLYNLRLLFVQFLFVGANFFLSLLVFSLSMLRIICLVPYFVRRAVFCSAC